ncbi:MAG: M20/M25/M40 family metallo-hydrolase, partial [Deltaproteobacteria bacterium]|nr:M20/M25/M40 family metallo-hydrolase [Deltaproteobacteria bacterium]
DPFSGHLDPDGMLWGRGALDMKGMGALELMTLVWLKRLDVPLERDVVLVAVADEEIDNLGMLQLVEEHWDRVGCSHLINEGGLGAQDAVFDGQTLHSISVAEKGVLWVRMVASGEAGHGSTPRSGEAPDRLLEAMEAIARRKPKPRFDPALYELLAAAGRHHGGFTGFVMRSRFLVRLLAKGQLMKNPLTRAAITDTVHLTGMAGGSEPNSVPSQVSATYDCRLLPGTEPDAVLAELRHLTRKVEGIEFEVLHSVSSNGSPWDDPLYDAIAAYAVEGRPNAAAGPLLSVGFTDSIYARPLGVHAYGYIPFEVNGEELATMHGRDERVSAENVREGLRRLFSIVVDFAGER